MSRRLFDRAYEAAMTKLAYMALDADEAIDIGRIASDPKMKRWQKETSDEIDREARKAKYFGIGLGSLAAGSAGIAALSPTARTYAIPTAIALGVPALAMGAGSAVLSKGKRMYDSDDPTLRDFRRKLNVDRHVREHRK